MNFLRGSSPQQQPQIYHYKSDSNASSLSSRSSNGSFVSDVSDPVDPDSFNKADDMVYVAMGKESKEWKANFVWVMQNVPRNKQITIVHINQPSKSIPMTVYGVVGWVPADQVTAKEVAAYRKVENEKMNKTMSTYMSMFARFKIKPEKLIIESDDIADGLLSLITKHGITELVMGAGADKTYSKTMKVPVSPTALTVQARADPACKIWFVCNGKLICTREPYIPTTSGPTANGSQRSSGQTYNGSQSDRNTSNGSVQTGSSLSSPTDDRYRGSRSDHLDGTSMSASTSPYTEVSRVSSSGSLVVDLWDGKPRNKSGPGTGDQGRNHYRDNNKTHQGKDDDAPYPKGRWTQDAPDSNDMKRQRDDILEELHRLEGQRDALEDALASAKHMVKDLQTKLSEAHCLVFSLEREVEELQQERACAVKEVNLLRERVWELEHATREKEKFFEFSYEELKDATNGFDNSLKIGEGGYGSMFKGSLRGMTVAIKLLNPQGMRAKDEFYQEMDALSKLTHLNVSTIIGACPEALAVVYEFLENGSLEDRLSCKDKTPPLTWRARARIAAEICSALIFLHSTNNKQNPVIHGDLKPSNILLDSNFVSRLGDYGIWHALEANATNILSRCSGPMGSFVYMDPEFFASGELRPCSDVYSFGIVLLRLLTGRPAMGILNEVQKAVERGSLDDILDKSAGEWPAEVAKRIAVLGMKCCEVKREMRPELATEAWQVLEPMINPPKLVDFLKACEEAAEKQQNV
ncbi:U-box domain-containing protein kinase family protein [Rhynchospora pubera]|uniref:RING-type E3 ubiquitin transferase n=1 Tax=Rhynchospora pubera TaxID=906938 RepID=A0AAV8E9Z9_9POAL|nr:U-box domain-containing protein kinase family protein [Rhynchospora pubera]